jgi:hypothetical protein
LKVVRSNGDRVVKIGVAFASRSNDCDPFVSRASTSTTGSRFAGEGCKGDSYARSITVRSSTA